MKKLVSVYISQHAKCCMFFLGFWVFCFANLLHAQPQVSFSSFIQNLSSPVEITNAHDGSGRLFIVEQGGKIKIYENSRLQRQPFLDLGKVVGKGLFQGIWSIAFSPNYKNDRTFFLLLTDKSSTSKLMRFQTSSSNPDSAIVSSGIVLISVPGNSTGGPHFGDMHFGPDGYLYYTWSDGSSPKNTTNFAQDGQVFMGKMLRINVNNINKPPYYSIPANNPFINNPNVRPEIWNFGFRDAWRWSFDRVTGDSWIADVGADSAEEVDFRTPVQAPASNFGFPCYEANRPFITTGCGNISNYVFPIFNYHHDVPEGGQTIIGGYVYRGSSFPSLQGYYICSDFSSNNLWKIKPNGLGGWDVYLQSAIPNNIVGYGEDENGELFAVSYTTGIAYKVQSLGLAASLSVLPADNLFEQNKNLRSAIYPTLINNQTVILNLKEAYQSFKLIDMAGREVMIKSIGNQTGRVIINLPQINAGIYIAELVGTKTLQQKIFVAK